MSIRQKSDSSTPSNIIEKNLADESLKGPGTASDKYEEISEDAYKQNSVYRAISEFSSKENKAA